MAAQLDPLTPREADTRRRRIEERERAREHRLGLGKKLSVDDHLDELEVLVTEAARIQQAIAERVGFARAKGAKWRQIGKATGTSAQAAYQRWTPSAKHSDRMRKAKVRALAQRARTETWSE